MEIYNTPVPVSKFGIPLYQKEIYFQSSFQVHIEVISGLELLIIIINVENNQ